MIYQKDMSSADFVLYLGIITQFTNWILGIFDEATKINKASLQQILLLFLNYES